MNSISSNALKLLDASLTNWYPAGSIISNVFGYQPVRWRKPRWIPKAPSKIYVVTHRRRLPPGEDKEVLRLYQNWKCFLKLTYEHCHKENLKQAESGQLSALMVEQEEEEHRQLMEYNAEENERVALVRKHRLEKEKEDTIAAIMEQRAEAEEKALLDHEAARMRLEDTEKLVGTFLEADDLERAIEAALNNPVDFNFAVDETGRVYRGRTTQPHTVDPDALPVMPIKDRGLTNQF